MERMGPEALLVRSRTDFRAELAHYAQLEYGAIEARPLETRMLAELAYIPPTRSAGQRLRRWGQKWLQRKDSRVAGPAAAEPVAAAAARESPVPARSTTGSSLAAMPAILARQRSEGG
jgi:hypothetical protein